MPNWKNHIAFGVVFVVLVILLNQLYFHFQFIPGISFAAWKDFLWFVPIIVFMSVAPDLDHQGSNVREATTILMIIAVIFTILVRGAVMTAVLMLGLLLILWVLPNFGKWKHRGHMHSFAFLAVLCIPIFFIGGLGLALLGFLAGISHLLADMEIKVF